MKRVFIIVMALMSFAPLSYADSVNYCTGNGAQLPDGREDKLLQRLIPEFAKEMGCEIDTSHCATKWDIQKRSANFSVAWKEQCGPIIDGVYQLGDDGRGSTFVCQKNASSHQTCCFPLGYNYVNHWVACSNESNTSSVGKQAIQPGKNFSAAIAAGDYVFLSGTIGIGTDKEPVTGIRAQTEYVLEKLRSTLASSNLTMNDVVKTTVFIRNGADFEEMNEVYRGYFPVDPPARSTVIVGFPDTRVLVEIEMIAYRGKTN